MHIDILRQIQENLKEPMPVNTVFHMEPWRHNAESLTLGGFDEHDLKDCYTTCCAIGLHAIRHPEAALKVPVGCGPVLHGTGTEVHRGFSAIAKYLDIRRSQAIYLFESHAMGESRNTVWQRIEDFIKEHRS